MSGLSGTITKRPDGSFATYTHPDDFAVVWGQDTKTATEMHIPKTLLYVSVLGLVGAGVLIGRATKKGK